MTTRLIIIRHGQSQWNSDRQGDRFNGRTDVPLTAYGLHQAQRLAQMLTNLGVKAIYSSPLLRAHTMAAAIGEACKQEPQIHPDLIEIDFGAWEGLSREEIIDKDSATFWRWVHAPASTPIPGGESGYAVAARVIGAISSILAAHHNQTVVITGHKVVNRLALCHFLGLPLDKFRNLVPQRVGAFNMLEIGDACKVCAIDDLSYMSTDDKERYQ